MGERIPQAFIDDLLDRLDIVDIVDSRVKLKRAGKNYQACCPFHDEKTPSFSVSPEKQFYYCFGCGASGNALGFVMDYDRVSFRDAIESLSRTAGVSIPETKERSSQAIAADKKRKQVFQLLTQATAFYQQQLRKHESRTEAARYLTKRGLSADIVKNYQLGLAPPGWDLLINHLIEANSSLSEDSVKRLAIEAGLLVENPENQRRYDRFRNRIMFPILDVRNRVIGFGGRVLDNSEDNKKQPKYLNSPETPVFHKGKELYGLTYAKKIFSQIPQLLVVEGYMDVVSLAQFDIHYAVATLGTACGQDHLELAFKHTQEVIFCFDGDKAGRNAAKRALENCLPTMQDGRQVKFLFLPEGEDPDTLVRQIGKDSFEQMIGKAVPLEEYLFDSVAENMNLATMEGRASLSKKVAPLINLLPKGIYRELMFSNLARRTELDLETLRELMTDTSDLTPQADDPTVTEMPQHIEFAPDDVHAIYEQIDREDEPSYYTQQNLVEQATTHTVIDRSGEIDITPEKRLTMLLVQTPSIAESDRDLSILRGSKNEDIKRFLEIYELLKQRPNYTSKHQIVGSRLHTHGNDDINRISEILKRDHLAECQERIDYDPTSEFEHCLQQVQTKIKKLNTNNELKSLSTVKGAGSDAEKEKARQLILKRQQELDINTDKH